MKFLTSTWMTAVIGAVVYLGATVAFWKTPKPPVVVVDSGLPEEATKGPSWDFINPEADQLIAELKAEKQGLQKKEQELNDLSTRLDAEKAELNLVTQSVHQLQNEFDTNVVHVEESETTNLKRLGKVYAGMSADAAANIFAEMDDTSVVKIMIFMKDAETAGIFEAIAKKSPADAKRAAGLSERLRLSSHKTTTK